MKDLCQVIHFEEVLSDYPLLAPGDPLYRHLKAACVTANAVRQRIRQSSTHPSANHYDNETYNEVAYRIDEMRKMYDRQCYQLEEGADKKQKILDIWAQSIERAGVGDCPEYAMLALKKLQTFYPQLVGESFALENVDSLDDEDAHEFLVIGRDPASDPEDYRTWGEAAVICDAWLGEVYPAEDLPEKLKCFQPVLIDNRQVNRLGDFDPEQHILLMDFKLNISEQRIEEKTEFRSSDSIFGQFFGKEIVDKWHPALDESKELAKKDELEVKPSSADEFEPKQKKQKI